MTSKRTIWRVVRYVNAQPSGVVTEYDDKKQAEDHALRLMYGAMERQWYIARPERVTLH